MATAKITDLTAYANPLDSDVLPIVDIATNQTKKVTVQSLGRNIRLGTAVASTAGTAIDFTSIPSWANRVTVMFNSVSTNGTSQYLVQIGTSSGVETTGYASGSLSGSVANSASGFLIRVTSSSQSATGAMTIQRLDGNSWIATSLFYNLQSIAIISGAGSKTLSSNLDRVRITTTSGTDAFDTGTINIAWEP